ncbi:MAG: response regulator, partial [Nodosilinea sp.]
MRILLIDDDDVLVELLAESLVRQRYAVDIAPDGETAQEFLALFSYDLIVLDWLLPDAEGSSLCQRFRQQGITAPVLMLTAKGNSADKVQALDAGADDYVVKPFDFEELCARIRALLRRDGPEATSELRWGGLSLNPSTFEVFYDSYQLHTTPKEYALLELFLRRPTQVFSIDAIITAIWSFEDPPSGDAVRTHIKGLRQKLKASGAPKGIVKTVYGIGYRLYSLDSEAPQAQVNSASGVRQPSPAEVKAAVAQVWERQQDTVQERLRVLEAAAAAMNEGQLSADLQQVGQSQAHKLAGSLGCYGFAEGSRIARELEQIFLLALPLASHQTEQVAQLVKRLRQHLSGETRDSGVERPLVGMAQLLVAGADDSLMQPISAEAAAVGIHIMMAASLSQAHAMLRAQPPAVALLYIDDSCFSVGLELLEAINHHSSEILVLVMTDSHDFQQRLYLVQQGVDRLLPVSTPARHIIEAVQQTLRADAAVSVVALDDDIQVLTLLQSLLSAWGMRLTTLADPAQLWDTLERVQPHLLVLDVEMPEANGLELCQVLRADDRWHHLPILFLTIREDAST